MDEIKSVVTGTFIGFIIACLIFGTFGIVPVANDELKKCEKDLPRSQKCVIIAVPEQVKEIK